MDFLASTTASCGPGLAMGRCPLTFLARWPADQAMQHARDRISELTARRRLLLPVEAIVQDVNGFLRGWVGYFKQVDIAFSDRSDRELSLFTMS